MHLPFEIDWTLIAGVLALNAILFRFHRGACALQILAKAGAKIGRARQGARFRATAERARIGKVHLQRTLVVTFYTDGVGLGTAESIAESFLPFEDLTQTDSFTFPLRRDGPGGRRGHQPRVANPLPPQIRKEGRTPG
jgi:hypothetical protein